MPFHFVCICQDTSILEPGTLAKLCRRRAELSLFLYNILVKSILVYSWTGSFLLYQSKNPNSSLLVCVNPYRIEFNIGLSGLFVRAASIDLR